MIDVGPGAQLTPAESVLRMQRQHRRPACSPWVASLPDSPETEVALYPSGRLRPHKYYFLFKDQPSGGQAALDLPSFPVVFSLSLRAEVGASVRMWDILPVCQTFSFCFGQGVCLCCDGHRKSEVSLVKGFGE